MPPSLTQDVDLLYYIVGIAVVLVGSVITLGTRLIQKGRKLQATEDEIKALKLSISDIETELQTLQKKNDSNMEDIQCLKNEIVEKISDVKVTLAHLEGSLDKIPDRKKTK